jgi:hypothetical protein
MKQQISVRIVRYRRTNVNLCITLKRIVDERTTFVCSRGLFVNSFFFLNINFLMEHKRKVAKKA